ncbi:MAG: hypothetical protein GY950_37030 [bacterium]|nr:hypothetical protein [bacterium]
MTRLKIIYIIAAILSLAVLGKAQETQQEETLFEEVTVVNTQLPVRVFLKGKPVGGLKKKDFKIFVEGKERPINGFYEVKKKLGSPQSQPGDKNPDPNLSPSPRLFVFIFNVSDYHIDVKKDIDILFKKILRPGDRFMVISNNFFLPERIIKDPGKEKKYVMDILKKEGNNLKMHSLQIETELRTLGDTFIRRIGDSFEQDQPGYPVDIFREYYRNYIMTFEQFKSGYFGMAKKQYIRIAEYLKSQDVEKWVLNFYQIGIFPQPSLQGRIRTTIDAFSNDSGSVQVKALVMSYEPRLKDVDKWMVDNISKLFINTGATVHTLLVNPHSKVYLENYEYKSIPTEAESILRKIARLTGGIVGHSIDTEKFIDKIAQREDVFYMLTYVPGKNEPRNSTIRIALNLEKDYRLAYDNKRKPRFFRNILAKIKADNPQVKIQKINLTRQLLSVVVSNIKMVSLGSRDESKAGKIEAKVMFMDKNSEIVWETKKVYKSRKSESAFLTEIPSLAKGYYDVIVEVRDLLSWNTDTMGENVRIVKN